MENEDEFDNDLLLDAAFQIIDASLDAQALFQEACQLSRKLKENSSDVCMTDLLCVTCTQLQKCKSEVSQKSMISTPALAKEVIRLAQTGNDQSFTHPVKDDWRICMNLINESIRQGIFIPSLFSSWISKHDLMIEFLWELHKIGAYDFYSYLVGSIKEPSYRVTLTQILVTLCGGTADNNAQEQEQVLTGVTNILINDSFLEKQERGMRDCKMYLSVLDSLIEGIIHLSVTAEQIPISPFGQLHQDGNVNSKAKKKFGRHALSYCLQFKADFKISERTPSTIQHRLTESDKYLVDCLKQLMECLSSQEVLDVLDHCLKGEQVNSKTTTAFLASMLSLSDESGKHITEYIKTSLSTGFQSGDISQITATFYIARCCCDLNNVRFPAYRDWYQQTFGETSTSVANTKTSFTFLIKCLTSWTPCEAPEYLKAHILRKPFIPSKMRDVYESYVLLAKTRLDDLKIPVRDVASSDSSNQEVTLSKEQQTKQMQQDVDLSVKLFEENGKIPTSVLEASIFRKPYFIGKFVPAMLKPRCLPDRPDAKMRLIEEMKKSGRIPLSMYNAYQDSCEKEKQNILEGIFDVNDDEDEEMLLSPMEQLHFRLDRIPKAVSSRDDKRVGESLLLVEDRMLALVNQMKVEKHDSDYIEIDISIPLEGPQEQIITKVLTSMSTALGTVQVDYKSTKPQSFDWLDRCLAGVMRFDVLKIALVKYLVICLNKKIISDEISLDCLGAVLVSVMCRSQHMLIKVNLNDGDIHDWTMFLDVFNLFLLCHSEEDITFILRLSLAYLFHAKNHLDVHQFHLENSEIIEISKNDVTESQLLSPNFLKKITLLCWRCKMEMRNSKSSDLKHSKLLQLHNMVDKFSICLKSDQWNNLLFSHKLNFQDWVKFESKIIPSKDILPKRIRLGYFWETTAKFIQEIGVAAVCSQLFHHLAKSAMLSKRQDIDQFGDDCCADFLSLLKGLLLQLPPCEEDSPWLLSTITSCKDKSLKSMMLRLSVHLHPHLLLCNNKQNLDSVKYSTPSILDLFLDSDLNEGGFFPLDIIIFLSQTCSVFHGCPNPVTKFLCHPAMFTSLAVHHDSLLPLGIFESFPDDFASLHVCAMDWADGLCDVSETRPNHHVIDVRDWMKASALYGLIVKKKVLISAVDFIHQLSSRHPKCLPFLLELMTAWLTVNMDHPDKHSYLVETFHSLVQRDPAFVVNSLLKRQMFSLKEFRSHIRPVHHVEHIYTFSTLRQCSQIAVRNLTNVCETLLGPFILAYTTLLESANSDMVDIYSQIPLDDLGGISSWLQSLVDLCPSMSLNNVNLNAVKSYDPLLHRKVYLKSHKS